MALRMAFAGFRHGHILGLYARAQASDEIEVVAACEEDAPTREALAAEGKVAITHDRFDAMLDETPCDIVAVGDYYARRGAILIDALERGCHVLGDKPLCTRLEEQDRIEALARERGLKVGCMLDLRDLGPFIGVRDLIRRGAIGEVHAVFVGGQHPLRPGVRPAWYFEPGKHGGTLNDIGIHALDYIPWATGRRFARVEAARCWNAFADRWPFLKDAAQMMLTLDNDAGVLGDMSYAAPDATGYRLPMYWRVTFWGREGVIETSCTAEKILLMPRRAKEMRQIAPPPGTPGGYLRAFLDDVAGRPRPDALNTESVLRASRLALTVQRAADEGLHDLPLE